LLNLTLDDDTCAYYFGGVNVGCDRLVAGGNEFRSRSSWRANDETTISRLASACISATLQDVYGLCYLFVHHRVLHRFLQFPFASNWFEAAISPIARFKRAMDLITLNKPLLADNADSQRFPALLYCLFFHFLSSECVAL